MSIYSDHKVGALTDDEFDYLAGIENRRDRWERTHEEGENEIQDTDNDE
jgi:hypothetical protein